MSASIFVVPPEYSGEQTAAGAASGMELFEKFVSALRAVRDFLSIAANEEYIILQRATSFLRCRKTESPLDLT